MSEPRVTGIGGVFFKADNLDTMRAWYAERLGVDVQDWNGTVFPWLQRDDPARQGSTTWSLFPRDSTYFGRPEQQFMVNYRVDDLDAFLATLRAAGVPVDDRVEESEYGRFGWCDDPEGNRVELWQPPEGM